MRLIGNILWLIFGGFLSGMGYILGGLLLCLTIVGIPFGVQAVKLGLCAFAPFGREIVERPDANSPLRIVFNILWIVLFGWEIATSHLLHAGFLALTIIGIPFAIQHIKLVPLSLLPFGRSLE